MTAKRDLLRDVRRLEDESARLQKALARALNERDEARMEHIGLMLELQGLRAVEGALRADIAAADRAMPDPPPVAEVA